MRFRPCIDIRDGAVVQIVGGTLSDAASSSTVTNFTASQPSAHFAARYRADALPGGHVILLGGGVSSEAAGLSALRAFPGGLQLGGGVTPSTAARFLDAGASHVVVTSYVFREGRIDWGRLAELEAACGRERLVLDLSARKRVATGGGHEFVVMTDRWQTWTEEVITPVLLAALGGHCAELLVHAVDVEGLRGGIEGELVALLGAHATVPVTYAGGVRSMEDVELVRALGRGRVDVSIGSALDIFGGSLPYEKLVAWQRAEEAAQQKDAGSS
jgi:phosphoribosylformimino-5-aminoimidazole carboxamide ribotide isomerase